MKMSTYAAVVQTGTVDTSGSVGFGFDNGGMSAIAGLLQNMYSDPYLAVLREYFCNAIDAHRVIGNEAPVTVTLPTEMNPSLMIQDFGIGLSREDLVTVYSTYGSSTKRNDNGQIGGFGIGSKSAFSLTEQFVVTGIKDGERTVMLFALGANGMGEAITIDHSFGSTEANGVTVNIPVPDFAMMEQTAEKFFLTWPAGSVLVDGRQPVSLFTDMTAIDGSFHYRWDQSRRNVGMTLIMGGVGYPVQHQMIQAAAGGMASGVTTNLKLVITAEVGSADITPSRESLRDTDTTRAFLKTALTTFMSKLSATVAKNIEDAPDFPMASDRFFNNSQMILTLRLDTMTWRGRPFEANLKDSSMRSIYKSGRGKAVVEALDANWNYLGSTMIVTGVEAEADWYTLARRTYAYQNLEAHTTRTRFIGVAAAAGESGWLSWGKGHDTVETITLTEFLARIVAGRVPRIPGVHKAITYSASDTYEEHLIGATADFDLADLREADDVIFMQSGYDYDGPFGAIVAALHPDALWIRLPKTSRIATLQTRLPNAWDFAELMAAHAARLLLNVPSDVIDEVVADELAVQADHFTIKAAEWVAESLPFITNAAFRALVEHVTLTTASEFSPLKNEIRAALRFQNVTAAARFDRTDKADKLSFAAYPLVIAAFNSLYYGYSHGSYVNLQPVEKALRAALVASLNA